MDRTARIVAGESKDMTDREMLELAAKAAGSPLKSDDAYPFPTRVSMDWNPLTDDGDAFRLKIHLKLEVSFNPHVVLVWFGEKLLVSQEIGVDLVAATRRAIVRAAAEIGRNMA
jgi:hypothetical protein